MSDFDYEIVDSSTVEFVSRSRSRKPKYLHKHWEREDADGMYVYYSALQRSYKRRHQDSETPYDHMIDQRKDYVEWWSNNTIHLVNIEQIRLEEDDKVKVEMYDACICRYCNQEYNGYEAVYNWVCMTCMENENYEEDM